MKKLKKTLIGLALCALTGGCLYVHRRVIHAWLNGEPMPKAPKWHFWCQNRES